MTILFEGCIKERHETDVTVSLIDLATDEESYAEIDLDKFPEDDREFCVPGALFTITEKLGGVPPEVALRRDTWTKEDLERIEAKARERWQQFQVVING